eukprot:jgi/Mesvir1/26834/Mv20591-RA.4
MSGRRALFVQDTAKVLKGASVVASTAAANSPFLRSLAHGDVLAALGSVARASADLVGSIGSSGSTPYRRPSSEAGPDQPLTSEVSPSLAQVPDISASPWPSISVAQTCASFPQAPDISASPLPSVPVAHTSSTFSPAASLSSSSLANVAAQFPQTSSPSFPQTPNMSASPLPNGASRKQFVEPSKPFPSQAFPGDLPREAPLPAPSPAAVPRGAPAIKAPVVSAQEPTAATKEEPRRPVNRPPPARTQTLTETLVPTNPLSRVWRFGTLAAGLAVGTLQETARRTLQGSNAPGGQEYSAVLTDKNAERLAFALCRMRGAALKLGQMLSIQDESLIPPQVQAALEKVRHGADVMPYKQLSRVLTSELGPDWERHFERFDHQPVAAASIGQVHYGVLKDGRDVAVKIQYPGVAESINSDVDNLRRIISMTNIFPKGLFIEQAIKVAKEELARECDYVNEAQSQKRFRSLMEGIKGFHVPEVVDHVSTRRVLTTTYVHGVPIDKVAQMSQAVRNSIAQRLLDLTLRELFQFRFMQTDPNWSNFLYDQDTDTLTLIDFGAARPYPKPFVDDYLRMVHACAIKDRAGVIEYSRRLGFLTGEENE